MGTSPSTLWQRLDSPDGRLQKPQLRIRGPGEGISFVIPALFIVPTKAGIQMLENLKPSPHRVPTSLSQQGFSEVQDCRRGASVSSGVAPWIPAQAGMTARAAGMMGRERGMTAWCSGPLIQNWGEWEPSPHPMAKAGVPGWQATAGLSPQPCHSAPLGHVASHPHPLIRNWG